jgi:hypothetical protein
MASTGADMACSRARLGVSWTDAGVVGGNDDGDDAVEEDLWDLGRAMPPCSMAEAKSRSWLLDGCGHRRGRRFGQDLGRSDGVVEFLGWSHEAGQILWAAVPCRALVSIG